MRRYYYIEDFADEVSPCAPTLEAWAAWLSKPDLDWHRPEAEKDEAEFFASTLDEIATVEAVYVSGAWMHPKPPETADNFVQRISDADSGWDPDTWAGTIGECLDDGREGEQVMVACCKDGPRLRLIYHAEPPRVEILGEVQ